MLPSELWYSVAQTGVFGRALEFNEIMALRLIIEQVNATFEGENAYHVTEHHNGICFLSPSNCDCFTCSQIPQVLQALDESVLADATE